MKDLKYQALILNIISQNALCDYKVFVVHAKVRIYVQNILKFVFCQVKGSHGG